MLRYRYAANLQLGEDGVSARNGDVLGGLFALGVSDLAVVDNHGEASAAVTDGPANLGAKLDVVVSSKDLKNCQYQAHRMIRTSHYMCGR